MKKKVLIGVSLAIVLVIAVTTIVLAVVQKSYKPDFYLDPQTVKIVRLEDSMEFESSKSHSSSAKFEKFVDLFEQSFKQSVLGSIFSGNSSKNIDIELVSKMPTFEGGYEITLDFKAEMTLKKDGKNFVSGTNSEKEIKYSKVIFNITEKNGYKQIYLYAKEVVGKNTYYYEISTVANTNELYNFVNGLAFA